MKEQLVSLLVSKVGLDEEKATQAVDTVMGWLQNNPEQIQSLVAKVGGEGLADKVGGLFGK